jgi:hypothetical protein
MKNKNKRKIPDPTNHFYLSIVKSFIRIAAGGFIMMGTPYLVLGGLGIMVAELVGILEEMV